METLAQLTTGHRHHGPIKIHASFTSVVGLDLTKGRCSVWSRHWPTGRSLWLKIAGMFLWSKTWLQNILDWLSLLHPYRKQTQPPSLLHVSFLTGNERLGSIPVTPDPNSSSKVATQNKIKPSNNRSRRSHPRLNKFVRRLHDMLIREKNSGIVEWRRGLLVLFSTDAFSKRILPKYFNTRNFKTFRRQVCISSKKTKSALFNIALKLHRFRSAHDCWIVLLLSFWYRSALPFLPTAELLRVCTRSII